jgi:hypothetical protein
MEIVTLQSMNQSMIYVANPVATRTSNGIYYYNQHAVVPSMLPIAVTSYNFIFAAEDSVTFTATPPMGNYSNYQWKINGVNVAGQTVATLRQLL